MRTVFTSYLLVNMVCAMVMVSLWIRNRGRSDGIGYWVMDFLFQTIGLLLILLRGIIPDLLSIVFANILIYSGTALLYVGLQEYVGKRTRQWHNVALLVIFTAVQTYYAYVHPSLAARNINGAAFLILLTLQCALLMLKTVDPELRPSTRPVGLIMLGFAGFAATRIMVDLGAPPAVALFDSPWRDAAVMLANQMLFIGLTFSLVLLVNRRLLTALEADLQERARIDLALRKSEEKFSVAFQTFPDAVLLAVLSSGELIEVNEAFTQIIGHPREQAIGRTTIDLGMWAEPEERKIYAAEMEQTGRVVARETTFRRASGEVFVAELASETLELDGSLCVLSVIRDVTQARQAERELLHRTEDLARSNRDLEQFAYVASHDLQEPLRMVINYTQLLQRRYSDKLDDDAKDFMGFAVEGARRMQTLITELLAYSRVETKGQPFESANLDAALDEALRNLRVAIEDAGAVITHDEMPVAFCDQAQIRQVFQNLIGNAVKFHGNEPPRIHVGVRREADVWVISVKDNGIGIESEYFEEVFRIYRRLQSREAYPGTGMGLAICKRIIERHGQHLWVESAPGLGTTFFFTLQAAE